MGQTQKQLAKQNGMARSRICRLEAGNSDRILKGYETILRAYGFTIVRALPDKEWNGYEEQA